MTDPNLIPAIEEMANNILIVKDMMFAFIIIFVGYSIAHNFTREPRTVHKFTRESKHD